MKTDQDGLFGFHGISFYLRLKNVPLVWICGCMLFIASALGQQSPAAAAAEPVEYTNSLEMVFHLIPAGTYKVGPANMAPEDAVADTGNPAAGETVKIERPFYIGIHEVRVEDYRTFCQDAKHPEPGGEDYSIKAAQWKKDYRPLSAAKTPRSMAMPITCVSFDDAVAFCQWLSKKEGRLYRLPTEVEWEYAARAGSSLPFLTSAKFDSSTINGFGSHQYGLLIAFPRQVVIDADMLAGSSKQSEISVFHAVPNAWGLYHMLGNVQEFVVMTRKPADTELPLPGYTGLPGKTNFMMRGGSWLHDDRDCSVFRASYNCPPYANVTMGFRVLLEMMRKQD
jgi:formylglycine-generating enzyme required for sulfatase activity